MKHIKIAILFMVLCLLSGFLPPLLCWIGVLVIYSLIFTFLIFAIEDYNKKKKKNNIKDKNNIIAIVLFIITIIFGFKGMIFTHNYNEVRKELNERFDHFRIVGVRLVKEKNQYGVEKYYEFKVKLPKYNDLTYHYSYRHISSTGIPYYDVISDWTKLSIPYYMKEYNKEHNTNITMHERCSDYGYCNDYIYIDSNNKKDVYAFLEEVSNKTPNNRFGVDLYIVDEDRTDRLSYPLPEFFNKDSLK